MNKSDEIIQRLQDLKLSKDEATLYLELLRGPNTHLKLAHATGINRTKVYRLAQDLQKRSLVSMRSDDRGNFLVAADPMTLEVDIVSQEEKVKKQRSTLTNLLPMLASLGQNDDANFVVHTYRGTNGFKQMLWHELRAKGESLIFGQGVIEDLVPDTDWAERHRAMTAQTSYKVREILNPSADDDPVFTLNQEFLQKHYRYRLISPEVLPLQRQIVMYNNTVAIYNNSPGNKVGLEITDSVFARTMRSVFEHYWQLAYDDPDDIVGGR